MNVKSKMKRAVQTAVSGDRTRFDDSKHNLDLTYITKRLIAMAFPASGFEAAYRNDIDDVSKMLNHYHGANYMVWNLSGRKYDYGKFNNQVLEYYFPDHHSPPLNLLFMIIVSMDSWLAADPANVAVIHCIGGKGRTGTVMACFLTYKGIFDDPMEALVYFGQARSSKQRGVTQVSQRRYVDYFAQILYKGVRPHPNKLRIVKIMMSTVPRWKEKGCRPYIHIYDTNHTTRELIFTTKYSAETRFYEVDFGDPIFWTTDVIVRGDLLLKFYHLKLDQQKVYNKVVEGSGKKKYSSSMFRASIHTAFVDLDAGVLSLPLENLDIYKKPKKFVNDLKKAGFVINIFFDVLAETVDEEEDTELAATYHKFFQRRVVTREEAETMDEIVTKRLNDYKNGVNGNDSKGNTTNGTTTTTTQEDNESGEGEKEGNNNKNSNGEENNSNSIEGIEEANDKELEEERKKWKGMTKSAFDVRKLGGSGSPLSKRLSLMSSSTLNRKRLFSFRTTKKTWEKRLEEEVVEGEEGEEEIPKEIAEADTDEELHASGSENLSSSSSSEDTDDSDDDDDEEEKNNKNNNNNESVVEDEKKRKEIEERMQQELKEEKGKKNSKAAFPNIKRAYQVKRSSGVMPTSRHLWEESGKRRATDDSATALRSKPKQEDEDEDDEKQEKQQEKQIADGEEDRIAISLVDARKRKPNSSPALSIGVGGSRISGRYNNGEKRNTIIGNASLKLSRKGTKEEDNEEQKEKKEKRKSNNAEAEQAENKAT